MVILCDSCGYEPVEDLKRWQNPPSYLKVYLPVPQVAEEAFLCTTCGIIAGIRPENECPSCGSKLVAFGQLDDEGCPRCHGWLVRLE